ncbi:50S ribosomal protein L17 [Enhygromyxa salina]|uniref:Large ribosomal subunit protein bL17 n=1 Tax=Enhygromyxa salina TaxID=215803 RepID=A0A2S9XFG1_9BACT|nr:50S ribosomal protein L17 [Enhygromyxa salina]PRP91500.1 50S ribosomal protein L17 [Enhygromyxa salina]
MRHQKSGRKLGRNSAHRKAMFRNMVTSLLRHERITTTAAKAKELRGHVERTISVGVRLGDLLDKPKDERTRDEQARYAHAMAHAGKTVQDREILHKLFEDIAPRARKRPGGYTRVIRLGRRKGDAAETAIIELVDRKIPEAEGAGDTIA